jgi:hypothetical protein
MGIDTQLVEDGTYSVVGPSGSARRTTAESNRHEGQLDEGRR